MGENSNIEWCHHTYNPWFGCTRISPACDHCYAAEWDKRYHNGQHWGAGAERHRTSPQTRNAPYRWARQARATGERPRVFCCSLADVFDNEVPEQWRLELWQVIRDTPELDWLLLTKRVGNVRDMLPEDWGEGWPHVWLGVTVVTQAEVDRDVPKLQDTPAAIRFLSCEPLLEPIDVCGGDPDPRLGGVEAARRVSLVQCWLADGTGPFPGIDWVIAGGESGPGARPMHPDWVRSLRDQCEVSETPFLFKQWGEWLPGDHCHAEHNGLEYETWLNAPQTIITEGTVRPEDCYRVGKKAAGRQLDGVTHDEFPDAPAELAEAERSYAAEDAR